MKVRLSQATLQKPAPAFVRGFCFQRLTALGLGRTPGVSFRFT